MSERLEEVKKFFNKHIFLVGINQPTRKHMSTLIAKENITWLIGRVEELEYRVGLELKRSTNLSKQNKRYKQALEEIKHIINVTPYREYSTNKIRHRLFDIATQALEK